MEVLELLGACEQLLRCSARYRPGMFTGEELKPAVLAVERVRNAVHCLSGALLDDLQQTDAWVEEGSYSAPNWAAARGGGDRHDLSMRMRTTRRLRSIAEAASMAQAGRLSPSHQRDLAACAGRPPDLVARDGVMLVELAGTFPA